MMISALLAILTPVPGPATSEITDPDHEHSWVLAAESEQEKLWIDEAFADQYEADDRTYPIVLVRVHEDTQADLSTVDGKVVVDCANSTLGMIEGWGISSTFGEFRRSVDVVVFDFATNPPDETDQAIFAHACGDVAGVGAGVEAGVEAGE